MFRACFISHAYPLSLSHTDLDPDVLCFQPVCLPAEARELPWHEETDRWKRTNGERESWSKVKEKRKVWRQMYIQREREQKSERFFFLPDVFIGSSPWELLVATWVQRDQMCYTFILLNLFLSHTLPNCPILFQFSLSPVCRCKVSGYLKWKPNTFLVQWSVVLWNSDSINYILNVVNELKKSYMFDCDELWHIISVLLLCIVIADTECWLITLSCCN